MPVIGLVIAVASGFTSTYTEVILKQKIPFWVAQVWLYLYGSLFSGLIFFFWDGPAKNEAKEETSLPDPSPLFAFLVNLAVVAATTSTGLVVANILRKKDNLVKLAGTSSAIVTIAIAQCILFSDLRANTLNVHSILGIGIIAISTWTYNYYKQVPPPPPPTSSSGSEDGTLDAKHVVTPSEDELFSMVKPDWKKVSTAAAAVVVLALSTAIYHPTSSQ